MAGDELELRVAWQRSLGRGDTADRWFADVVARHREPHRHYHGLRHVRWVVRHVIEIGSGSDVPVSDLDATVVAAFFHDAVYDPTRSDNEAVSARLATRAVREIGWSSDRAEVVATMIEATANHTVEPDLSTETAVLFAADLAVLAGDAAAYGDYVRGVRHEYAHVGDDDWRTGRAAVLHSFLERETIFDPALGLDGWEHRARANLTAELAALER